MRSVSGAYRYDAVGAEGLFWSHGIRRGTEAQLQFVLPRRCHRTKHVGARVDIRFVGLVRNASSPITAQHLCGAVNGRGGVAAHESSVCVLQERSAHSSGRLRSVPLSVAAHCLDRRFLTLAISTSSCTMPSARATRHRLFWPERCRCAQSVCQWSPPPFGPAMLFEGKGLLIMLKFHTRVTTGAPLEVSYGHSGPPSWAGRRWVVYVRFMLYEHCMIVLAVSLCPTPPPAVSLLLPPPACPEHTRFLFYILRLFVPMRERWRCIDVRKRTSMHMSRHGLSHCTYLHNIYTIPLCCAVACIRTYFEAECASQLRAYELLKFVTRLEHKPRKAALPSTGILAVVL